MSNIIFTMLLLLCDLSKEGEREREREGEREKEREGEREKERERERGADECMMKRL